MGKTPTWKIALILALLAIAALTLYPPEKTLKPGIDLAGGTSLIYEIDAHDLSPAEKGNLAQNMITILRRRVDPANIQNLIWRPLGDTRFEIQMPLASAHARIKRQNFEEAINSILAGNINIATIMRSLQKDESERLEDFKNFAKDLQNRHEILENLAGTYDQRNELQNQRDSLLNVLRVKENSLKTKGLDVEKIKQNRSSWAKLNEMQLAEVVAEFSDLPQGVELVRGYIETYSLWAEVVGELTDPQTGKNTEFKQARAALDKINLNRDQLTSILEMPAESAKRAQAVEELKTDFPERKEQIDKLLIAFDEYRPFRGRLDDPKDLQRMLKGAGILEFRILPTVENEQVDADQMAVYAERLKTKGPKYASDDKYVWCEIEDIEEWPKGLGVVALFGNKYYVLASNQKNQTILHAAGDSWSLEKAAPRTDQSGRRAIGFQLNEKGGRLFWNVTSNNIERPLCILLDGVAISAPKINDPIRTSGIITGSFTQTEVTDMVNKLNAGSLPARLIEQPISVQTIGPSIGAENRDRGIKAGFIGLFLVLFSMLVYYMLAGAIADIALLLNILFVLAIMALLRATFTLPGIAGIILTIGMSVDANVLIFERIREEQQSGSSMRVAVRNGYQRAFRTILDANLTTFITAAILYWVASEQIKGFAIVLMLGIASSMFTALFVTRTIFDLLLNRRIIKNKLFMLRLIGKPNINWMKLRPLFFGLSIILIAAGMLVFFQRNEVENSKYDIEFTGGTSVQINLKPQTSLSREQVEDRIRKAGNKLQNPNLAAANVYKIGQSDLQYEITTTETNKTTVKIVFPQNPPETTAQLAEKVKKTQNKFAAKLSNLRVTKAQNPGEFVITTSQVNKSLVKDVLKTAFEKADISEPQVDEVVNNAILAAFEDVLEIQQNLEPQITSKEKVTEQLIDSYPELTEFLGGIKINCKMKKTTTAEDITERLANLRFKPDMRDISWYPYTILDSQLKEAEPNQPINSFVYISIEPEAGFRQLSEEQWKRFSENETRKVLAAAQTETSLPKVTQIDPSVGAESKTRALIAIVLSLFAIVAYIWVRFGNIRYGIAAITALVHDVCITLGAITACTYLASTAIGEKLLIGDFKIDLAMIAAFLTLIGYSLNDTIVVFDRIRENRKKAQADPRVINNSINQILSRTILTSFTTFIVVFIMYIFGGQGLRGFTFAIGLGIIVGTYSSIAIAAPILLLGQRTNKTRKAK